MPAVLTPHNAQYSEKCQCNPGTVRLALLTTSAYGIAKFRTELSGLNGINRIKVYPANANDWQALASSNSSLIVRYAPANGSRKLPANPLIPSSNPLHLINKLAASGLRKLCW